MKHPKVTPPRPFTPKKKPAPYLVPAVEKALAESGGGALIREDLEKTLMEIYTRSFPSFAKLAKAAATVKTHSWHPPYGTPMRAIPEAAAVRGMAMGDGQVYCYEHGAVEAAGEWERDTE